MGTCNIGTLSNGRINKEEYQESNIDLIKYKLKVIALEKWNKSKLKANNELKIYNTYER